MPALLGSRVAMICDAGPRQGVGHVMRCVALGEELVARGLEVFFLADLDAVPWAAEQVTARGMQAAAVPTTQDPVKAHVDALRELNPIGVVVDSYTLPLELYVEIRRAGHRTLALVDGDPGGRVADIYVDQNIGAEHDRWELESDTVRLAGLTYALIRSDFLERRPQAPRIEPVDGEPSILAFFGGTDAHGSAPEAVALLVATRQPWRATVVGADVGIRERLGRIEVAPGQELTVIEPTPDLARLVSEADLVISAAGTSSWELFCLGAATAFVCVADNQREAYGRIVGDGLAAGLGTLEDLRQGPERSAGLLGALLADAPGRAALRRSCWTMVDGRGRSRVADALLLGDHQVAEGSGSR